MLSGNFSRANASDELRIRLPSNSAPGSDIAFEPVAMTRFFVTISSVPELVMTLTDFALTTSAVPSMTSTLLPRQRAATPLSSVETTSDFHFWSAPRSTLMPSAKMPNFAPFFAFSYSLVIEMSALEGMQP